MLKNKLGLKSQSALAEAEENHLLAMERSPIKDTELKLLLQEALSDEVESESVFMRGIDASYAYEGYEMYRLEELEILLT